MQKIKSYTKILFVICFEILFTSSQQLINQILLHKNENNLVSMAVAGLY